MSRLRYGRERPTLYTAIGERIMLARRRAGLSQQALGDRLGVTHAAISDLERAITRPDLDNLAEVARVLSIPLTQLVVLDAPPASSEATS